MERQAGPPLQPQASGGSQARPPDLTAPEAPMLPPSRCIGRRQRQLDCTPSGTSHGCKHRRYDCSNPSCPGGCQTSEPAQCRTLSPTFTRIDLGLEPTTLQPCIRREEGGSGAQKFVYTKWIFRIVNFAFSHYGHFGVGGGGAPPMGCSMNPTPPGARAARHMSASKRMGAVS